MKPVARYLSFTGNAGSYGLVPLDVLAGATTFTIEVKFATASTKNSGNNYTWGTIVGREIGGFDQNDFGLCVNNGKLCFWAEPKSGGSSSTHNTTSSATVNDGKIHKAAVVSNADGSIDLYCDGELVAHTDNVNAKITDAQTILLAYNSDSHSYLQMDLYEARFWSIARTQGQIFADIQGDEAGLEAWYIPNGSTTLVDGSINGRDATLYGTPAYTYVDIMPIDLSFDVVRKLVAPWRYVNAGTADDLIVTGTTLTDLPESKSITGTAFYQTQRAKCFDIPTTDEIWIKFNVYFDGTNRWRAYNTGSAGICGVCSYSNDADRSLGIWYNSNKITDADGVCKVNQLQTVLLHMVTGSSAGVIEAWVDGSKIYTYTGDVNHGEDFADIYLQSDGGNTFFSNVIISNSEINHGEGWQIFTFDTERQVAKAFDISFDVERKLVAPWRYVNAGTADDLIVTGTTLTDLPESKSITGTAFYQTQRAKCFDIPTTDEIWIKFNVYFDGTNRWRAFNGGDSSNPYNVGVTAQTHGSLSLVQNSEALQGTSDICKKNQLQTVLLHMVSGSLAGVVEAWVDGTKIYRYVGDVNHGEDFADIYLQSDGAGTFFSNVIISNAEIEFGEGWQIFTFDTERQVAKAFDISFDVERQVQNVTPFQIDFDVEIKDILPVTISADTERKIIVLVDLSADVELLALMLVDFTADVARNIKANINLYKTDNSEYFSGGSSVPIVIPTQEVVPPATSDEATTQSIEITIAEQQITDQVKVVTAIPLDIMYPVQGQYLDYCCDMRVERVQRQGILYTADCCSDLDALLYTQLAYKLPTTSTWQKVGKDNTTQEITTYYPPATAHVASVAKALGLTPVMQFDNFLSTLLFDDLGGLTYADIIRDVFGWSSRVPTHLINCYIRNGILYVIQRGHEANVIDISGADMTLPIFTHELVRTTWGSSPNSATETREQVTRNFVPADSIAGGGTSGGDDSGGDGDSGGDSEKEKSWLNVGSVTVSDSSGTTTTTYSYDSNGILRETVAVFTSRIDSKESSTTTTTNSYNSDKLLSKTEVDVSHPYNHDADTLTITTYGYKTLANNQKFLSTEMVTMYENGKWVDTRVTTKSPTGRGQGATTDNSGNTDTGGNISDDRATPYSEKKAAELIKSLPENATDSDGQFVDGVSLYDSSFPVHDTATLIKLTNALKWLNRKTRETVNLSIYNFPHLIDFNDRIVLFGETYFLASNRAHTNPRIYNEQALTLVRWY